MTLSKDGTVTLWNTEKQNLPSITLGEWGYPYWDFYPSQDHHFLVARPWGGGEFVYLLKFTDTGVDLTELKIATEYGGGQAIYIPDGDWLLTTGWQAGPGKITLSHAQNPDQSSRMLSDNVSDMMLFPDERRLLITKRGGDTRLWDLTNSDLEPRLSLRTPSSRWASHRMIDG